MEEAFNSLLSFAEAAEGLKSVPRTAWTASGRRESSAEHSWRLALLALAGLDFFPGLNRERVLGMCLVHDLGETDTGDISAASSPDPELKRGQEEKAVKRIFSYLPPEQEKSMLALWREYEEAGTPEAKLVKALDKAETILQHTQGRNPPDFDYSFNLSYGQEWFQQDPALKEIRRLLDEKTGRRRKAEQGGAAREEG